MLTCTLRFIRHTHRRAEILARLRVASRATALAALALFFAPATRGQVSPRAIRTPELRELQTRYLQQLKALNSSITAARFPYPFTQARYVEANPSSNAGQDRRGIEFVRFHGRLVLKVTGRYNAALSSAMLSGNERATRVFADAFVPILRLVRQDIPSDIACDAIGLEIAYHVLGKSKAYEYEGKEILVTVFHRDDAFALAAAENDAARQVILNRSELYLDGEELGLALGQHDPLDLETLSRRAPASSANGPRPTEGPASVAEGGRPANPRFLAPLPAPALPGGIAPAGTASSPDGAPASHPDRLQESPLATRADAEKLQAKYQAQLDALAKEGLLKFRFVDYAPPSFVLFQDRLVLQLTLRNPARFDREHTSIYKRAAQSFDLFLAPQLKELLSRISTDVEFPALDITILTQFQSASTGSPEAVEFISPLQSLREFADARITNQDLINQSIVLVNGVRVALNLQAVE